MPAVKKTPVPVTACRTRIDAWTESEWMAKLESFPGASIYQSYAYGSRFTQSSALSHLGIEVEGELVVAAQVAIRKISRFSRPIAYVSWGPMLKSGSEGLRSFALKAFLDEANREYVKKRGFGLIVLPHVFRGEVGEALWESVFDRCGYRSLRGTGMYRTFCLDLRPSVDDLRKNLQQKWRNGLNGAERNGMTVVCQEDSSAYGEFLELYDEMIARKKFEVRLDPRSFFDVQESLPEKRKLKIFLCRKGGKAVCGAIVSCFGEGGLYLFGATNDDALLLKASYLLHWEILKSLKAVGIAHYDLGGIDPEANPGVYHFKRGFSGDDQTLILARERGCGLLIRSAIEVRSALRSGLSELKRRLLTRRPKKKR